MICSYCKDEKEKSLVYPGPSSETLMGWSKHYDEEGVLHYHDPNRVTQSFKCSRGHEWSTSRSKPCFSCDYGK